MIHLVLPDDEAGRALAHGLKLAGLALEAESDSSPQLASVDKRMKHALDCLKQENLLVHGYDYVALPDAGLGGGTVFIHFAHKGAQGQLDGGAGGKGGDGHAQAGLGEHGFVGAGVSGGGGGLSWGGYGGGGGRSW